MAIPLRVLILEDQTNDVELMLRRLRRAGFAPDWQHVETRSEYVAHLSTDFDVILADYNLPRFNALHALRLLQEHGLDIPFIIVTGGISEQEAIECVRQGAADYLFKDRLGRLGAAVARTLQEKKLRDEKSQAEEALRESEARYRLLAENAPDIIYQYRLRPSPGFEYVSPASTAITGYTPEEYYANPDLARELTHPDDGEFWEQATRSEDDLGLPTTPLRWLRKDGAVVWVEQRNTPLHNEAGQVIAVGGVIRDVTERVRLLETLKRRNTQLQTAAQVSKSASTILEPEALLDKSVNLIRERFDFYYVGIFLVDEAGEYAVLRAGSGEAGQRMLEAGHRLAVGGESMVGRCAANSQARISLDVGQEAVRFDNPWLPETRSEMALPLISHRQCIGALTVQSTREAAFSEQDVAILQTMADQLAIAIKNASLFQQLDAQLEQSRQLNAEITHLQQLLQNITDSLPSVLITLDSQGRVLTWNPAAEALTGQTAARAQYRPLWQTCPELAHYRGLFEQVLRERRVIHRRKERLSTAAGEIYHDVSIFPLSANAIEGIGLNIDDVTRRVQLEEVMLQSVKMASVGGLAAGVAHEINNPLGGMMQSAQVLQMAFDTSRPRTRERQAACGVDPAALERYLQARGVTEYLQEIRTAGERAAKIVTDLLSFSRKSPSNKIPHDLNALVMQTLDLAATDYDLKKKYDFRNIAITRELAPNLPQVACDGQQIQQVVLNLVRNAAQAMAGGIESGDRDREYSPRLTLRTSLAPDASFVRLEVEDNGPGVPAATRKRLFEPFFTTKEVGQGTGLGLWLCWSLVVERHGGRIWEEPATGEGDRVGGSRFVIELPVA
jgi:PAS domain S-box-containing protein